MNHIFLNLPSGSKYYNWYVDICQHALLRVLPNDAYVEIHHILPKSIFPEYSKDPDNLVKLTAREHFICHWLLTKIISTPKSIFAFQMMIPNKTSCRYFPKSASVYSLLKEKFSKNNTGTTGKCWITNGVDNKFIPNTLQLPTGYVKGRTFNEYHKSKLKGIPKTKEHKAKQSAAMTGKPGVAGELNPAKRAEVRAKISKSRTGTVASPETKLKMRLSKLGKPRGPYNKSSPK